MYVIKRDHGVTGGSAGGEEDGDGPSQWEVVHRSSQPGCVTVEKLWPNTRYQFRIRHLTNSSASALSAAAIVYTPPLAPHAPVLVSVQPRGCRLVWRAGDGGAAKFRVEYALVENLAAGEGSARPPTRPATARSRAGSVARRSGASASVATADADAKGVPLQWNVGWEGKATMTLLANLQPSCVYRVRVIAMNAEGGESTPSMCIGVTTADPTVYKPLSGALVATQFPLRVTPAQLTVGDTIHWSEQVWLDGETLSMDVTADVPAMYQGGFGPELAAAAVVGARASLRSRTPGPRGRDGRPVPPVFVASRTIAAVVVRLPVSTSRRPTTASLATLGSFAAPPTSYAFEAVWSTVVMSESPLGAPGTLKLAPGVAASLTLPAGKRFVRPPPLLESYALSRSEWYEESLRAGYVAGGGSAAPPRSVPPP